MTVSEIPTTVFVDKAEVVEDECHRFSAEASELRWAPGFAPTLVGTNLGNGQPFLYRNLEPYGTMVFQQVLGCIQLRVYND